MYIDELKKCGFSDPYNTALTIHTRDFDYPLSFIAAETKEELVIMVTDESGRERMRILNKKYVEAIDIVYQDEISIDDTGESNRDRMYN